MNKVLIRDLDPVKAPYKTAQDLLDALKKFSDTNDHRIFGFTRNSLRASLRCDDARRRPLISASVSGGYLVEEGRRLYPQPSLHAVSFLELMGSARFKIQMKNGSWRITCSWCGLAQDKFPSQDLALSHLQSQAYHRFLTSHSLERSKVVG